MAFTNAELVRAAAGDPGRWVRDVASGDAASTEFYVSATPLIGNSQTITVGGAARTEVAAAPGATEYTINDESGRIIFGTAPATGTDNIIVVYKSVRLTDAEVTEAIRQFGLVAADTAEVGPTTAVYSIAAWLCDWMAAATAGDYDFETDGQSYKRGTVSASWAARAEVNRGLARRSGGLISVPVTRMDGYARRGEYTTQDIGDVSARNPRRRFYGEQDVLP